MLIFVHAFVNFCGAFTAGVFSGGSLSGTISSYAPEQLVSALPYLIVTLVLLRPSKMRQIIALHNGVDALQLPEKLESSKRSKLSRGIAVAAAVIISIAVIAGCYYFSFERVVISYSRSDTWNGEDSFSEVTDSFTVDETGYYTYTFSSYSSSSSAVTIFNVYENGILIYSAECQGNGSYSINIEMYDTSTYAVEFVYDYSRVEDRSESYQTSLDVVKAF